MLALAKTGDKFVIEVDKVFTEGDNGKHLYRIKGFNSLVFDDNGIKKLEQMSLRTDLPYITEGSVWKSKTEQDLEIVVFSVNNDVVYGINRKKRITFVLPTSMFVQSYEKTTENFNTEIGLILGDLPF